MYELHDNSVDMIVTSPPYWNSISYDRYIEDNNQNYKTRKGISYENYLRLLHRCLSECYRVLRNGRYCCIVINSIVYQARNYPIPFDLVNIMKRIGFDLSQEIIWNKCLNYKNKDKPEYPGQYYPNFRFEYILIFQKPGTFRSSFIDEEDKIPDHFFFPKDVMNNVWNILPVKYDCINHPCPFPEEIPYRLIQLYSFKGDIVLDPFMGSGTTALVAKTLERKFIGYEVFAKFIEVTKERLKKPLILRNQVLSYILKLPGRLIRNE
jgi:site-specific DNA-methyltransferase (adenine-specific)